MLNDFKNGGPMSEIVRKLTDLEKFVRDHKALFHVSGAAASTGDWSLVEDTWTRRTQAYTNDPASGSNITLNMTNTLGFKIGSLVQVSSSAGSENAVISALVANTSITVYSLTLNHTTTSPLVVALNSFTLAGDFSADNNYKVGKRVRYQDGGNDEYGVIFSNVHSSGTTYINLVPNSDYAFGSSAITDTYVSDVLVPDGFPEWFNYTIVWSAYTPMTYTSVTTNYAKWRSDGGSTLHVIGSGTGTTGGTASRDLLASLPVEPTLGSLYASYSGWVADGGQTIGAAIYSTAYHVNGRKYDASNFGLGSSRWLVFDAVYEF